MLLAFDLDKTLVTDSYDLPDPIAAAIDRARDAGHLITVLTGRARAAALPYLERLEVLAPYSVNHGAYVVGPTGELLRESRLTATQVGALLDRHGALAGVEFSAVVDDVLYVRDPDDERWAWAHTLNREVRRYQGGDPLAADKLVFSADGHSARLEREILGRHPELVTYLWDDGYLEVTGPDADKGGALALIASALGVPRDEVIAFGDGLNDVTMLRWAGRAVAVGPDAHPAALAEADEHIAPPEDLGVARWLDRFLS